VTTLITGDLHNIELTELAARIKAGDVSPVAVTRAQLDRIAALDGELASYALVMADVAMAQAEAAEAEIAAGRYRGPLHGVPIAVKDLFWTKGVPTAGGMAIYKDFRPVEDATVVRRLRDAGAVLLGKLQMTEGAYSDYHPSVTPPKNPWGAEYWSGISSSGPGVATAAGLCFGSLGSDTGGSIRWPSAANGVTGLKPTWGRVSRHGAFQLAATLDHVGPIARSAADAAAMLAAVAGADPNDPTTLLDPVPDYLAAAGQGVRGLRIGVDPTWNSDDVDATTQTVLLDAIEAFRSLGAEIVDVRFPDVTQAIADWVPHCAVEAAVAHEATYPARKAEYGPILASVLEAGWTGVSSRSLGEQPELIAKLSRYTFPFDMTGSPTITLPGGFSEAGLPIAFQLVAADLGEATLIRAGAAFQRVTSWHRRHPDIRS
jgi:amidase